VWKQYIDILPNTLKLIREQEKSYEVLLLLVLVSLVTLGLSVMCQVEAHRFQNELERLNPQGMRSLASKFIATLSHTIHRIVHGSSEAPTSLSGQTLQEEILAQGS
jgi:hypothetical protein